MRSKMLLLLAGGTVLRTALACSIDDRQVTSEDLLNQPGAGGRSSLGGAAAQTSDAGVAAPPNTVDGTTSGQMQPVLGTGGGAAAGSTAAGAPGQAPDAGRVEPAADPETTPTSAAPQMPAPTQTPAPAPSPAPAEPTPAEPAPAEVVGFTDVFPILVAACGNCHGANAAGNRPRFAQTGNEAASLTAALAASTQGGTVAQRIIMRAVTLRNMPPTCAGGQLGTGSCLDAADAELLQEWVDQGTPP